MKHTYETLYSYNKKKLVLYTMRLEEINTQLVEQNKLIMKNQKTLQQMLNGREK